jgi:hypothetical protein
MTLQLLKYECFSSHGAMLGIFWDPSCHENEASLAGWKEICNVEVRVVCAVDDQEPWNF